jgi:hypothetical protein
MFAFPLTTTANERDFRATAAIILKFQVEIKKVQKFSLCRETRIASEFFTLNRSFDILIQVTEVESIVARIQKIERRKFIRFHLSYCEISCFRNLEVMRWASRRKNRLFEVFYKNCLAIEDLEMGCCVMAPLETQTESEIL